MKKDLLGELLPTSQHRRTKIIATMGPASRSPERVRALIQAGVNVFRLNFSHGSHADHLQLLQTIRGAAKELQAFVGILQDLSGPKIRISNVQADFVLLQDSASVTLRYADHKKGLDYLSDQSTIYVEGIDPVRSVKVGDPVLLADGSIALDCTALGSDTVVCTVVKGGRLRSRVGIAFPDSNIDLPATTEKDLRDLQFGIEHEVDYVAISFVQNARDVQMVRQAINKAGANIRIISKIERKTALGNIFEILDVSDGVMIARGDLGLEFPLEQLPMIQKRLIEESNYRGVPVIVATQMLHSMIAAVRPTRAEVSDVSAAVMSGADAVMLSEETAIGENPIESVNYLSRIALEAERSFDFDEYKLRLRDSDLQSVPDAVSYAACGAAVKVKAAAIVACTETGHSARLVAKYRPQQPLFGLSAREETLRRMALYWGVIPVHCATSIDHQGEITTALRTVQSRENLPNGSLAVVIGGTAVSQPGTTSIMEIKEMSFR